MQTATGEFKPTLATIQSPRQIQLPESLLNDSKKVTAVSAGGDTSYLVIEGPSSSEAFSAGFGQFGELGHGKFQHMSGTLQRLEGVSGRVYFNEVARKVAPIRIRYLTAGRHHAAAVMSTEQEGNGDSVFVWGLNKDSQLGIEGSRANQGQPVPASAFISITPFHGEGETEPLQLSWARGGFAQRFVCGHDVTAVFTVQRGTSA